MSDLPGGSRTLPVEVMFFLPQLGGGGAEMNAVRLASGLLKHGVRPSYVVTRGPGSYAEHLPREVDVVVLDTGGINSSTLRLVRSIGPLAEQIERRRPGIVCPVMPLPSLAALAAVGKSTYRPKVVLSLQNTLELPPAGTARVMKWIERALLTRKLSEADMIVALSRGVGADIARFVPQVASRIHVVHNVGLPLQRQLDAEEPEPPPPKRARLRFLACGRLVEQKGYPFLLDAFAKVTAHEDVELHILGQGPLKSELEARVARLGVADRVRFLGFRRNPFVHMAAADVFVLSSLWEGFGNVLVEAMSMGAPVVSTACPHGPDEIIEHEKSGLLVPPADADALAAAMLRLAVDDQLRSALAGAGRIRAQEFSADKTGRAYATLFKNLVTVEAK